MYCIRCGKEIPDLALNCPYCGSVQVEDASPADTEQLPRPAAAPVTVTLTKRNWAKLLLIGALLCFFLPFAAISCTDDDSGRTIYTQTVSGFEMMSKIDDEANLSKKEPSILAEVMRRLPSAFSIAAFAAGVFAVTLLFLGRSARVSGRLAAASAVFTLLIGLFFFLFYSPLSPVSVYSLSYGESSPSSVEALRMIRVKIKPGLLLAAGCFTAGAIFCRKARAEEENQTESGIYPARY